MTKTKVIILACCTLTIGMIIGGSLVGYMALRLLSSWQETNSFNGAMRSVRVLEYLRQGDVKSPVESLEVDLDCELASLWGCYKGAPADKRDPRRLKFLAKIRDYRKKYPRSTGHPELDSAIAEVLKMADSKVAQ